MGTAKEKQWHEDEAFLDLRKQWYEKLEKSGFEDIEHVDWKDGSSGNVLNGMSGMDMLKSYSPEGERYFELARQYLWTLRERRHKQMARWRKDRSKKVTISTELLKVWALHSEGVSAREISRRLGLWRVKVSRMINQEKAKMLHKAAREGK